MLHVRTHLRCTLFGNGFFSVCDHCPGTTFYLFTRSRYLSRRKEYREEDYLSEEVRDIQAAEISLANPRSGYLPREQDPAEALTDRSRDSVHRGGPTESEVSIDVSDTEL